MIARMGAPARRNSLTQGVLMKILLCDMPLSSKSKFGIFRFFGSSFPPMNLLFLGTQLKQHGHQVRIATDDISDVEFADLLTKWEPDIVGVTFMSLGFPFLKGFVDTVRAALPKAHIITGGYHSSLYPEEVLGVSNEISAVFVGEAENSILEYAEVCQDGPLSPDKLKQIHGICFKDHGKTEITQPRELIGDLDQLHFPDFELIPDYFKKYHAGLNRHFLKAPQAFLLTGRGCSFNCHFCGRKIFGSKIRQHSTDYKVELVKWCKSRHGINGIVYGDEFFTHSKTNTTDFCEKLKQQDLHKLKWVCGGRVSNIEKEFAQTLRSAGCMQLSFGLESGSQTILQLLNKKTTLEQMRKAIRVTADAGIQATGNFMIGCPGETRETLEATYRFIMDNPLEFITLTYFTPLPGSYFWEHQNYIQYGKLINDDLASFNIFSEMPFVPFGATSQMLSRYRNRIYRDFYFKPKKILNKIHQAANKNSMLNILQMTGLR